MRVELEDIKKYFGPVRANDGISLTVEGGTIHGLLGENGAGKTTLMKILSGYQSCDAGRILLDGEEKRFASPAEAIAVGIGMLHQDPLDVPSLSVLDNFSLGRKLRRSQRRRDSRQQLLRTCAHFGFNLDPDVRTSGLTVGERQQLELVRLLSLGVQVVILDEPTTGISAPQKALLFDTLRSLARDGLSIIFVSHKLDEVGELCSEVMVLRQGKVAGRASPPFSTGRLVQMMFDQPTTISFRAKAPLGDVALELDRVSIHTHRLKVESISLTVRQGEMIGLAGLEGSGQRALLEACAGLQRITSGRLLIDGRDMTRCPYRRFLGRGIAFLPAGRLEEGLVPGLTLREHFALVGDGQGTLIRWKEVNARTDRTIREFNVIGSPETMAEELSGGNQQRAMLSLLPQNLRLLLLEHPTRGLDLESADWIWSRLLDRRRQGTTILFTSTDLDELVHYSDRIVVFSGGVMSEPVGASEIIGEGLGYLIGGGQL